MERFDFTGIKPTVRFVVGGKAVVSTMTRNAHAYDTTRAKAKKQLEARGYMNIKTSKKPVI